MIANTINPKKALNKAFRLIKPKRQEIESFKTNMIKLLGLIDEKESEENVKIHLMDFFKNTGFNPDFLVATKGRTDFVIHTGKEAKTPAGILFEVKRPTNKVDMVSKSNLNAKAMHELILYYLRERLVEKNNDIRHLVITNIYEWYIFDVFDFERIFFKNTQLVKAFQDWNSGQKVSTNTDLFYNEIAKPFLQQLETEVDFTWFDIRTFEKALRNENKEDDKELIALFKILSPTHLLKLKSTNDSNSLDKSFYAELLHIIGLEEIKEGSKKLIRRKETDKRDPASLLENTITILDLEDSLHKVTDSANYGEKREDRLFNVGLELCITWINRILFLKLLEAQLIKYHKGDKQYKFLNFTRIPQYDELYKLFFQVLAKRPEDRAEAINKKFANIPYLNSSLFEISELEDQTIKINSLDNSLELALYSGTVLRDEKNKPVAKSLNGLQYLFDFLEAYDFASEGSEDIQEESKTLINASVLGLIFEKINGYKDGSFFTPGFITMYMCRETIRRAVVQKFNDAKGWNCTEFDQLYNKIEDSKEANEIINSLKICDPAVGSGHFLVSALNEIIAIKNDLRILQDRNGKRLKEYIVEVENDELMVSDIDGDMYVYQYLNKESQRVQEALFHEKQTIIENCLFGVDINPNSVKICRLRLWIELLKNAYYIPGSQQLETLPNIDINIKCGNSLISRFALDADLSRALKSIKYNVEQYRGFVNDYKNAHDKELKRGLEQIINTIKTDFRTEISKNDPKVLRLKKVTGELFTLLNQVSIFELDAKQKKAQKLQKEKLEAEIEKLSKEVDEIKSNALYRNAFEWRFEFPEVLDNDGNFVGFDAVIGNPPYLRVRDESEQIRKYYFDNFKVSENQLDLYHLFIERTFKISNSLSFHSLIVPNAFLANQNNTKLRQFILTNFSIDKIIEVKEDVFEEASVDVLIYLFTKPKLQIISKFYIAEDGNFSFNNYFDSTAFQNTTNNNFTVTIDTFQQGIISKILNKSVKLSDLFNTITGIKEYQIGKGKPPQNEEQVKGKVFNASNKINETYLPELRGKNLSKYSFSWDNEYISYGSWLAEPRIRDFFEGDKILIRQIPAKESLIASYVKDTFVVDQTAYIAKPKIELNILYYLGLLNSKLIFWYFQNVNNEFDQLFPKIKVNEFNSLPLPDTKFANIKVSNIVAEILKLKSNDTDFNSQKLEQEIDQLVYQLYELTEEEIKIVEGK